MLGRAIWYSHDSRVPPPTASHGAPPGYYFLLFFLTFWPASLLAGLATHTVWRARAEAPVIVLDGAQTWPVETVAERLGAVVPDRS